MCWAAAFIPNRAFRSCIMEEIHHSITIFRCQVAHHVVSISRSLHVVNLVRPGISQKDILASSVTSGI